MHLWLPVPAPWQGLGLPNRRKLLLLGLHRRRREVQEVRSANRKLSVVQGPVWSRLQYLRRHGSDVPISWPLLEIARSGFTTWRGHRDGDLWRQRT